MFSIKDIKKALTKGKPTTGKMQFGSAYSVSDTPVIKETLNKDWVLYGRDNLYPQRLKEVTSGSPIHNAIVKTKSMMTGGDGFLINGANNEAESLAAYSALDAATKDLYDFFLKNELDCDNASDVILKLAYDLHEFGAFAYEKIWNTDFTKIVRIKHVKAQNIRSGKYEDDKIKYYYYSREWEKCNQAGFKFNKLLSSEAHEDYEEGDTDRYMSELVYEKIGSLDYYGEPSYKDCLTWIQTDCQMGIYHLSNIENGMNPGLFIKFYEMYRDENDKQEILDGVRNNYKGPKNTGKTFYSFTEGKDIAPDITPIQTSNIDKQQMVLAELCDKKILTGHQLTSPLLVGISVSGQLGGNIELEKAYLIFDNVVMASYRNKISRSLKKNVLDVNGINIDWEIAPYNPFKVRGA